MSEETTNTTQEVIIQAADAGDTPNTTITATPSTAAMPAADPQAAIHADINTIKAAIADLQVAGKDLFAEEITNLQAKLANAETELEALATDAGNEIPKEIEKVKTWSEQFRENHGVSVPVAVVVGGYIVWQVAAAVGRVMGWL